LEQLGSSAGDAKSIFRSVRILGTKPRRCGKSPSPMFRSRIIGVRPR